MWGGGREAAFPQGLQLSCFPTLGGKQQVLPKSTWCFSNADFAGKISQA
jgi:hypothetical protein